MKGETRGLVCGIGVNDAAYQINVKVDGKRKQCPFYTKWASMLKRCYSEKELKKNPSYRGCSVIKEWHLFSNFKAWMEVQDWKDKDMDKDIIIPGNKIYSPDTCCMVDKQVNYLILNPRKRKNRLPIGAHRQNSKYAARIRKYGKMINLGAFDTAQEASERYLKEKCSHIQDVVDRQSDVRVRNGLLYRAGLCLVAVYSSGCAAPCIQCLPPLL